MGFFRGRYGNDQFGIFLFIVSLIVEIIGRVTNIRIIYYIGIILFVYMFARMFSRNIYKRQNENMRYLAVRNRLLNWRYFSKNRRSGRKSSRRKTKEEKKTVYCYYYCPSCKQQVRVPAGKGKIKVKCPRCGDVFDAVS